MVGVVCAVAVVCGVGGAFVAPDVVGALGRLTGHDPLRLRLLGWCWGGLPWLVASAAFLVRRRLSAAARVGLAYGLGVWCASGAILLPSRGSSAERRFGSAYLDSRPLTFGWACGWLPAAALVLVAVVATLLVHRATHGNPADRTQRSLGRGLAGLWMLLLTGGLVTALAGPLP